MPWYQVATPEAKVQKASREEGRVLRWPAEKVAYRCAGLDVRFSEVRLKRQHGIHRLLNGARRPVEYWAPSTPRARRAQVFAKAPRIHQSTEDGNRREDVPAVVEFE